MGVAWRIAKKKYVGTAFDGEGAYRYGGRWNSVGTRVVYASSTLSLAALEILVHLNPLIPMSFVFFRIEFDDAFLEGLEADVTPLRWKSHPPSKPSQRYGDDWVREARSPVLAVPSVIIPTENNLLLNPNHPSYPSVDISGPQDFAFDPRLSAVSG